MNMVLVCTGCQCNVYVIPKSIGLKDLGYKGYEPHPIANFVALLVLLRLLDLCLLSFSVSSAVDSFPACLRFNNMHNFVVDSFHACLRLRNMNNLAVDSIFACLRFINMNTFAGDLFPSCLRFSNMNNFAVD